MFIKLKTAHDENEIMLNTDRIVFITYYTESNMSRIYTVLQGYPVWVDGNFMDRLDFLSSIYTAELTVSNHC